MNRIIGSDAILGMWESARSDRAAVAAAFAKVDASWAIPPLDRYDCAKEAVKAAVAECGLHHPGTTVKYEALGGGKCAIEVLRKIKGEKRNKWPHLFSVALNADTGRLEIISTDPAAGVIHDEAVEAEDIINETFIEATTTISAKDLTESIVKLIRTKCHAISLKSGGGTYMMAESLAAPYESLADDLNGIGPEITVCRIGLSGNPTMVERAMKKVNEQIQEGLTKMRDRHADLMAKGGKTRSNGNQSRVEEISHYIGLVKTYRALLGEPLKDCVKAIKEAKAELGIEAMRSGLA